MVYSELKQSLFDALDGKKVEMTPVVSFTQTGIVDLMDETGASWPRAHSDPEAMSALAMGAHDLIGFEAVRVPYCLTVLAEALGCDVNMGQRDRQPSIASHPLSDLKGNVDIPSDLRERGRIPIVLSAIEGIGDMNEKDIPVIAGFEGPCTVASDLIGAETFMLSFIKDPDYASEVIRSSTEACIEYATALEEAGADVICVADPVASPELISPKMFDNHVKKSLGDLAKKIRVRSVLHICGNVKRILGSMSQCGFDALSIEEKVRDIEEARGSIEGRSRLVGNVACATTLFNGTPAMVKEEATNALSSGIDVLSPGCGLAPKTPIANARALVEARDEYFT